MEKRILNAALTPNTPAASRQRRALSLRAPLAGLALSLLLSACASTSAPSSDFDDSPEPLENTAPSVPTQNPHPKDSATPVAPPVTYPIAAPASTDGIPLKPKSQLTLTASTDVWDRIRRGFAMPDLDNDVVRNREQWYASRPDYMLRMTERSRPYLFHVVEELERRKMPTELALLPFIESAFNPQAVSSAKAAGIWQFMPATGRHFDLKQNLFRDERRDVLESTRAALDYLQMLYNKFGHWHLALAAYNWGEGNVGRALARNKAQGKPLTYSDLGMPNETRFYVPKLQAVKNIVATPEAFNTQLPLIQNHPYFKSVPIERDIDVAVAAQLATVSLEDFKALNPAMSRPVILAAGTPHILLPWDNADIFESNLRAHAGRPLATWTAWKTPQTMTVEAIAQHVNMDAARLRSVNSIPPRMLIKANSTLLVLRQGSRDIDVSEHLADNAKLGLAPEVVLKKVTVKARKGDSLASLAARHGVSPANAAAWNQLKANAQLSAGQTLTLLIPTQAPHRAAARTTAPRKATKNKAAPSKTAKSKTATSKTAKSKAATSKTAKSKAATTSDKKPRKTQP